MVSSEMLTSWTGKPTNSKKEKLIVFHLVKNVSAFYGTWRLQTILTRASHFHSHINPNNSHSSCFLNID